MIAFMTIRQMDEDTQAQYAGCPFDWPYVEERIDESKAIAYRQLGFTVLSEDAYEAYKSALQSQYNAYVGIAPSTWAVDLNGTGITISGTAVTKIIPTRILWDVNSEYSLSVGEFFPKYDGVRNLNGTITFTPGALTSSVKIHIYRNDELWFTVWSDEAITPLKKTCAIFSCDCDCYASEGHEFELRFELGGVAPSVTVSGVAEETAWGMTYIAKLEGTSPT